MSMARKLRDLIESTVISVLTEIAWEGFQGEDLEAKCNHCNQALWLVWEESNPMHKWTECGGIGEGSCHTRLGYDPDEKLTAANDVDEPPLTLRSPTHDGISTKLKRSI